MVRRDGLGSDATSESFRSKKSLILLGIETNTLIMLLTYLARSSSISSERCSNFLKHLVREDASGLLRNKGVLVRSTMSSQLEAALQARQLSTQLSTAQLH